MTRVTVVILCVCVFVCPIEIWRMAALSIELRSIRSNDLRNRRVVRPISHVIKRFSRLARSAKKTTFQSAKHSPWLRHCVVYSYNLFVLLFLKSEVRQ